MTVLKSLETKKEKLTLTKLEDLYRVTWDKNDKEIHQDHVDLSDALETFEKYSKIVSEKNK